MSKVMKLLEELDAQMKQNSNSGISVRKLGEHIGNSVVAVDISMRCPTGRTQLPDLVQKQAQESLNENGEAFYQDQVSKASIALIPKEFRNNITRIEKGIRRRKDELCIARDYMPVDAFMQFKAEFEKARSELFDVCDEIIANWDSIRDSYESGLKDMLGNIQMPDFMRDKILGDLLAAIPERETFRRGFSMNMRVFAFPSEPEARPGIDSSISDAITETWKDDVVSTAILAIERSVGEGWERLNAAMKQYLRHGSIRSNTINTIIRYAQNLAFKNVFRNGLLTELAKNLMSLASKSEDQQAEQIEECIAQVYQYAKESGINLDMENSPYSTDELDVMAMVSTAA